MKTSKFIFYVLFAFLYSSCSNQNNPTRGIEGLWISSEETSRVYSSGVQKTVLDFRQIQDQDWEAHGVLLWNGDYSFEWELSDFSYDEKNQSFSFTDRDGDTFKGTLDKTKHRISINVYFEDGEADIPDDSIMMIPADEALANRLFFPRFPDNEGEAVYSYETPEQENDGLETASIYNENTNPDALVTIINKIIDQEYGRLESLLIIKDNKLIVEEYFYGYDRTQLHKIFSCTKSVTSLLLGIALERNKEVNVDKAIFDLLPGYDSLKTSGKEQITLQHVLSMTAGLQWQETPREMYDSEDRIHFILNLPLEDKPGENFLYNSGLTVLIGKVIEQLEGKDVKGFADESLFQPLGITDYKWRTHKNGELEFWNGLQLLPRDMAKIGLLVLNKGMLSDKQIVPQEWIDESTRTHASAGDHFKYAYQWWLRTEHTKKWWYETEAYDEHNMTMALGWGNQYIIIVKDLNLVIVTTASNQNNGEKESSVLPMIIEDLIPAISYSGE